MWKCVAIFLCIVGFSMLGYSQTVSLKLISDHGAGDFSDGDAFNVCSVGSKWYLHGTHQAKFESYISVDGVVLGGDGCPYTTINGTGFDEFYTAYASWGGAWINGKGFKKNYTDSEYYLIVEISDSVASVTYTTTAPVCYSVSDATISASSYCSGSATLTASATIGNAADGYPKYAWYDSNNTLLSTTTTNTYDVSSTGTYYVTVYASSGVSSSSESITVATPDFGSEDLAYTATPLCNGSSTVTVTASDYCADDGYPHYYLYNAGDGLVVADNTTGVFSGVAKAGSYYAIVYINESTYAQLDGIVVSNPSVTLSLDESSLSYANETWGDEVADTVIATVTGNYCGDLDVTAVSSSTYFTVGTIEDNGDGTFAIPVIYNEITTANTHTGTLTVTATTNAYSAGLTPATASSTVSLSGTTTCNPPTITIEKHAYFTAGDLVTCGCNLKWYMPITELNQYNSPLFYVKEDAVAMSPTDAPSGDKKKIIFGTNAKYGWSSDNPTVLGTSIDMSDVSTLYIIVERTSSSTYELSIVDTTPTCTPTVGDVNLPSVCINTVLDLTAYTPSVVAASTVTGTGWEYSTDGTAFSKITDSTAFTADQEYYIRYYATDENGTGYSAVAQIQFKESTIATMAGFTETAYCTNTVIDLTTDPGAPSYTAADCGTPSVGFEYSSDGSTYTAVDDPTTFSLSSVGTYYVRYKVTTDNGSDYSNAVALTVVGVPSVADNVIPSAICDGGTLTLTVPTVNSYYILSDEGWEISTDGGISYVDFDENTSLSSATYNGALLRYSATNTCGTQTNTGNAITVNTAVIDITSADVKKGATLFEQAVVTPTTTSSCVDELTYSLASVVDASSADASSYFTINTSTGVVSTTNTVPVGTYTVTIQAQNSTGSVYDTYEATVEITARPSMNLACPDVTAVETNRCTSDNVITYTLTTSTLSGDKITLALSGTAAKYYTLSPTSYTPTSNSSTQAITLTQSKSMAAGTYGLTLTATVTTDAYGEITASCSSVEVTVSKYDDAIGAALTTSAGASSATVYCSEELALEATSTSADILRYDWYVDGVKQATTSDSTTSVGFDCSDAPATIPVLVLMQNEDGCLDSASIQVTVNAYSTVYYYCGETGASSDVTKLTNWCTSETGTAGSCTSPTDFVHDGCQYIINKDDVELLESQTWTVSGTGTKITLGDGWWQSTFANKYGTAGSYYYDTDNDGNNEKIYCEFYGTLPASSATAFYTNVSNADYREYAKTFSLSGTLTGGATIDVRCGSELEVNTDAGAYTIGECETMYQLAGTSNDGSAGDRYNVMLIPGSIVTYNGDGAKVVQATTYADMYINTTGDVTVEDGDVVIMQSFKYDQTTSGTYDVEGTNFIYAGSYDQDVAAMTYDDLTMYNSNTKTLTGNVTIENVLEIGSGCTLDADDDEITLSGCNTDSVVLIYDGDFEAGTSTVHYVGACAQKVAALPYYNLDVDAPDVTTEKRIFAAENVIGIAGTFTIDNSLTNTDAYTTEGSTIEFNGTTGQTVPTFTYYNMVVNNSGLSDGAALATANFLTMTGDVVIENQLTMTNGVLYTGASPYDLTVTNTASNAVLDGYYTSDTEQSFIQGTLTRYLPASSTNSEDVSKYIYPVGEYSLGGYMPLTMQGVTTGSGTPQASVTVQTSTPNTSSYNVPLKSVNSEYYWFVDGNDAYNESRVTLSTPRGDMTKISADANTTLFNCVAYNNTTSNWDALNGTTVSPKLIKAYPEGAGYYTFGNRTVEYKTFYYNCASGGDITELSSWWTGEFGTGSNPASFDLDYATWIIECDAEITKDFSITGSNTHVAVQGSTVTNAKTSPTLTISGGTTEFVSFKVNSVTYNYVDYPSHVVISSGGALTVHETLSLGTDESSITNRGTMNIYAEEFSYYDAWIKNYGTMNFNNCDFTIYSNGGASNCYDVDYETSSEVGHFMNYGTVEMTNCGLTVRDRFTQLYNGNGAVWTIDNTTSAVKRTILFDYAEIMPVDSSAIASPNDAYNYVNLECGSAFYVKNSDVDIQFVGHQGDHAYIGGLFIVEDGDMGIGRDNANGGKIAILECGQVLLYDTDNSGDAIFNVYGVGGTTFDVYGTMYAMGLVASSTNSGSSFNIKDGGLVFIGDMGATLPGYSWSYTINVETGGTLNYCGNRSSVADNIGTNNGYLNYAESFYTGTNPIEEGDFSNIYPGDTEALYASIKECMIAYNEGSEETVAELLPVELTMLYGVCDENDVVIRWQTASETNNNYFVILRSFNGIDFEEIAIIDGAGTTTIFHDYEYVDSDIEKQGIVYYKLRQVDYNGTMTDSKVIAVQTCGKNAQFSFYADEIDITFANPEQSNYVIITSITGQIFYSKSFRNVEEARIAAPQRAGIYVISVIDARTITSEKFIRK